MSSIDVAEMAAGYIAAALWADCLPMCNCSSESDHADCEANESGGLESLNVSDGDTAYVVSLCAAFIEAAGDALEVFAQLRCFDPSQGTISEHIGHDLRLTSAGHGTGFWDRGCNDAGRAGEFVLVYQALQDLSHWHPFDRSCGGDVCQIDANTARFDHLSLEVRA